MLIDATHPEETRVVVAEGSRVEDFDFESINKRQLAGNIYLAKVTRVEPSLQAAFVEYGGNRHGFLAFGEIHPDYYQIPRADREALLAAEASEAEEDDEAEERPAKPRKTSRSRGRSGGRRKAAENPERATPPASQETSRETGREGDAPVMDAAEGAGVAAGDASATAAETGAEAAAEGLPAPADVVGGEPPEAGAPPAVDDLAERPDAHLGELDVAPTGDRVAIDNPETPRLSDEMRDAAVKAPDDRLPESADVETGAAGLGLSEGAPPAEHMTAPEPDPAAFYAPETEAEAVVEPGTEIEPPAPAPEADAPRADDDQAPVARGETAEDDAPTEDREGGAGRRPPRSIAEDAGAETVEKVSGEADGGEGDSKPRRRRRRAKKGAGGDEPEARAGETPAEPADPSEDQVDTVGAEPVEEEVRPRRARARTYKIQEVIKVRQILLVQVVKEERGNKGAALTTYLSLAGRYCVLMPNTARGGGISRKITSVEDRKKLKEIAAELEVPKGMGLIVRTAGAQRTRAEIKRDYEFLIRQWDQIRELTLKSVAPCLIYEEGSLIKRSIRDLYSKDIDEVLVAGEEGYREAKDYMRMLMPSHAKNVKPYREPTPLFSRYQVESYLAGMFNPTVQLKSGGYIVIGVTEALVAIDVNSGRSTREGSIEETALKTNLEAAEEIARQLRLRDLAGLIVVDFIDMDERRNNAAVEKRFKEKLKNDRARLQVGRISPFGLLEMSRQRLRPGMLEAVTAPCPHCHGSGSIRSDESLALSILREVEEEGVRGKVAEVRVCAPVSVANYIINQKRSHLAAIEGRYAIGVAVEGDPALVSPKYRIDRLKQATRPAPDLAAAAISAESAFAGYPEEDEEAEAEAETPEAEAAVEVAAPRERREAPRETRESPGQDGDGRNRRRRGRRGGRRRRRNGEEGAGEGGSDSMAIHGEEEEVGAPPMRRTAFGDEIGEAVETAAEPERERNRETDAPRRRRRRRGGEDRAEAAEETPPPAGPVNEAGEPTVGADAEAAPGGARTASLDPAAERSRLDAAAAASEDAGGPKAPGEADEPVPGETPEPAEARAPEPEARPEPEPEPEPQTEPESRPRRSGWWGQARKLLG